MGITETLTVDEVRKMMHLHSVRAHDALPAREGWVICDHGYMLKHAPGLMFWRGDGWWTKEHAFCFPTEQIAKDFLSEWRSSNGIVVEYLVIDAKEKGR